MENEKASQHVNDRSLTRILMLDEETLNLERCSENLVERREHRNT